MGEFVGLRAETCFFIGGKTAGHKLRWSSRTGVDGQRAHNLELPSQLKEDASL